MRDNEQAAMTTATGHSAARAQSSSREPDDVVAGPAAAVTPLMVQRGFQVLRSSGIADEYSGVDKQLVVQIYLAMLAAARQEEDSSGQSHK